MHTDCCSPALSRLFARRLLSIAVSGALLLAALAAPGPATRAAHSPDPSLALAIVAPCLV